jgi:ABC-2 type transport system permease protein
MNKLLSSGFSRLKRDKIFWVSIVALLAYSIIYMLNGCRQSLSREMAEFSYSLDVYYFHYGLSIGLFCSVFTSIFLGVEYQNGAIRNKLIIGHTRTAIYLSNLLVSFTASIFMLLAWLIGALVGIPFLGTWKMGPLLLLYLLISVLFMAAFSAIFTFIGMLTSYKTIAQIFSLLFFFALLLGGSMLYEALQQPEMTSPILMTMDGMQIADPVPNPSYVTGPLRSVYEFLVDLLPTGQGIQLFDLNIRHPLRMILSSLGITAGVTAVGIRIFQKKDLN